MEIQIEPDAVTEDNDEVFGLEQSGRKLALNIVQAIKDREESIVLDFTCIKLLTAEASWGFVAAIFEHLDPAVVKEKVIFHNISIDNGRILSDTMRRYEKMIEIDLGYDI